MATAQMQMQMQSLGRHDPVARKGFAAHRAVVEGQESWDASKIANPSGSVHSALALDIDTDAETVAGHSGTESPLSEWSSPFTPLSQTRVSPLSAPCTPKPQPQSKLSALAPPFVFKGAAPGPAAVAAPPGLGGMDVPPGLEEAPAAAEADRAAAAARQLVLDRAASSGLPLKVRAPAGVSCMPQRAFDITMPVKKGLQFQECAHMTKAVMSRLQPGVPAKKRPNEEFLLAPAPFAAMWC